MTEIEITSAKAEIAQLSGDIAILDRDILKITQLITGSESYALVKEAYDLQYVIQDFINALDPKSLGKQSLPDAKEGSAKGLRTLFYNMQNYGYRNTDAYVRTVASEKLLAELEGQRQVKYERWVELERLLTEHGCATRFLRPAVPAPAKTAFFAGAPKKTPTSLNELYGQYTEHYKRVLRASYLENTLAIIQTIPSAANTKAIEQQAMNPRTYPPGRRP